MVPFNLPPGARLDPPTQPALEDLRDELGDLPRGFHPAIAPLGACTYPARPVNGGSLERALPKTGRWQYEPKYNGWRALVHAPTGTMFNRYGQRLSIAKEFSAALARLRTIELAAEVRVAEWFDCEALERRHGLGQGTLMVFDYIVVGSHQSYQERKSKLAALLPGHDYGVPPEPDSVYGVVAFAPGKLSPLKFYNSLRQFNRQWSCPFYEGLLAKRSDSFYPVQLRSPTLEFVGWMKHRWAG